MELIFLFVSCPGNKEKKKEGASKLWILKEAPHLMERDIALLSKRP